MSNFKRAGTLDRGRIIRAAFELIEIDGVEKFSMRKLGARLGVDPMSVYYYVPSKGALLDAMVVAIHDEIDVESLPWDAPGRSLIVEFAWRFRCALRRHPAMVSIVATRPLRDQKQMEMAERAITRLCDDGYPPRLALTLVRSVQAFTVGHVLADAVEPAGDEAADADEIEGHIIDQSLSVMSAAINGGPRPDDSFETALTAILDGFDYQRRSA